MEKFNDLGYVAAAFANIQKVLEKQADNIRKAGSLMAAADTPLWLWERCSSGPEV